MLEKQDVVIGADICFRGSMVQPLYDLIARACGVGTGRIVLSDRTHGLQKPGIPLRR